MIKDRIENSKNYYSLSKEIKTGFEWIINNDLISMEDGKYEISDKIYANIQSYETKEDALFEAHRKYIDIQYMIQGAEKCGLCNYAETNSVVDYDNNKDIEFLNSKFCEYYTLKEGEFFVFYPQDAHKPALCNGNKDFVKKVVVKVMI